MRSFITFTMAMLLTMSCFAQRENNRYGYDDYYYSQHSGKRVKAPRHGYDRVEYVDNGYTNTLRVNEVTEYVYETDNVRRVYVGHVGPSKRYVANNYPPRYRQAHQGPYIERDRHYGNHVTNGSGTTIINYGNNVTINAGNDTYTSTPKVVKPKDEKVWYVCFSIGKYDIDRFEYDTLAEVVRYLKANPNCHLEINGYADVQTGDSSHNYILAKNRIKSVVELLLKEVGSFKYYEYASPDKVQPYGTNDMNRCVIIKAVNGSN